ncbi:MAG: prephenate dehydratase [Actinobacteria bacterium]|nr:MAG: prephenate dehydratase [Actinomycetota bacterium]
MRIGYLGPEGTFSGEALRASGPPPGYEAVGLPTIHDTVMAVQEGTVDWAIVPIENSIEGSVDQTLDALALDAPDVEIVGEAVHPVHHSLIAARELEPAEIRTVVSHPQVIGQCARFIRALPSAHVETAPSTAEAVRSVAERPDQGRAALGNRLSAELYGCLILRDRVEDHEDNETRFVWLGARAEGAGRGDEGASGLGELRPGAAGAPRKTSLVFWGTGASRPGWLVACLSEFASRQVNLTRIESRPRGHGLGRYMFFADLEGSVLESPVADAIAGLRGRCDDVRVLGSYPAA